MPRTGLFRGRIYEIWQGNGEAYREINICAEYIIRPIGEVAATMLHEMAHLYDLTNGIKDVSNNGYYHNMKFKETAEAHGLHIEQHATYGWTITMLTEETAVWLAAQPGMEDIAASRKTLLQVTTTSGESNRLALLDTQQSIFLSIALLQKIPTADALLVKTKYEPHQRGGVPFLMGVGKSYKLHTRGNNNGYV